MSAGVLLFVLSVVGRNPKGLVGRAVHASVEFLSKVSDLFATVRVEVTVLDSFVVVVASVVDVVVVGSISGADEIDVVFSTVVIPDVFLEDGVVVVVD